MSNRIVRRLTLHRIALCALLAAAGASGHQVPSLLAQAAGAGQTSEVRPDSVRPGSAAWALRSSHFRDGLLTGSSVQPRFGVPGPLVFPSEGWLPGGGRAENPCGPAGSAAIHWPERMDPLSGGLLGGLLAYHDPFRRYRDNQNRTRRTIVEALFGALTGQPISESDVANYRLERARRMPGGAYTNRFPCTGPIFDLRGRPQGR